MNWLGSNPVALVGAALGCWLGFFLYGKALDTELELLPLVGICAGLGAALCTDETTLMRGLVVGAMATWVAAAAEVVHLLHDPLIAGLARFHAGLNIPRFVMHLVSTLLAIALGSSSLRPGARARVAGN
jgi:hypothetical protein